MYLLKFIRAVAPYGKRYYHLVLLLLFGLIFTGSSIGMLGITIKHLVDIGFSSVSSLFGLSRKFLLFSILMSVGTFMRIFSVNLFSERLCASIKKAIYNRIIMFPVEKYDSEGQAQWINFISNDVDIGITSINTNISIILRNCTMFVGAMILLVLNSWKLSLIVIGIVPIIMGIISIFGYKLRNKISEMKSRKNDLFLHFSETILFVKTVKAFCKEKYEVGKLTNIYQNILSFASFLFLLRGFFIGLMIFLMLGSIASVIYLGGRLVVSGTMTIGSLSSFIFQSIIAASAVGGIIESISEITKNRPIFEKIYDMLNYNNEGEKIPSTPLMIENSNKFNIKFENVSFAYKQNPENIVLKNFNLEIRSGEKIALVGQSGSGKSTILGLLLRFYENYDGKISIDGNSDLKEIRSLQLNEYRNLFGVVFQEVYLFSGTIKQNLIYGCDLHDEEFLLELLEKLDLKDFIFSLPDRLNTKIGDKSIQLSGGQKQRVGIIRALLKKPKILIFDEANSALDSENEKRFYNLLFEEKFFDISMIFITHRLSHLDRMDRVIKMDKVG